MTDLRCLLGRHNFERKAWRMRVRRSHGIWVLRQKCKRCPAELLIEGPRAEIIGGIRSR